MKVSKKIVTGVKVVRLFKNWAQIGRSYLGLAKNGEVIYILRNGIKFKVASNADWPIILAIWSDRLWTPVGDEIQSGYTVVDVGAHIGVFSVFAATQASDVTVFSYEPYPKSFKLLEENIEINNLKSIKPFPIAVGGVSGKRRLFIAHKDVAHSVIQPQESYIEVDCITLKETIDQVGKCDFLKINCEGAEYEILLNTPKDCLRKVGSMTIDCHTIPGYNAYDLEEYLEQAGFQVVLVEPSSKVHTYLYARNKYRQCASNVLGQRHGAKGG